MSRRKTVQHKNRKLRKTVNCDSQKADDTSRKNTKKGISIGDMVKKTWEQRR